jgi:hypothetical protein
VDALRSLYIYAVQRELVDFSPIVQLRSPGDGPTTPPPVPYQTPMPTHQTPMPTHQTPIPTPPQATTVAWQPPNGYEQPTYNGHPTHNGGGNGNGHHTGYMQTLANMTTPVPIQQQPNEDPFMRALTPDKILWWSVLLIVVVAVLIAIVLAAESV